MKTKFKIILVLLALVFLIKFYFCRNVAKDYPIVLWWTKFTGDNVITCDGCKCLVTEDRLYFNHTNLAAIAFYGSAISLYDLPLPRSNRTWAIYHEESSRNLPWFLFQNAQQLFNATATFSRYSNFPITLADVDLNAVMGLKYYVPLAIKKKKKLAPVVYVQSICDNPMQRDAYVEKLMKYINVDSYGKCLNNKQIPENLQLSDGYDLYQTELMQFLAQYKFMIAIENSNCSDYITEKLWRSLIVGSIPIYLGSSTIRDWLPNNKSAILIDDFKDVKALADYINLVNRNDSLYLEYMRHKLSDNEKITNKLLIQAYSKNKFPTMDGYNCYLCKNFYQKFAYPAVKRSPYDCQLHKAWEGFWHTGRCEATILNKFVNNLQLKNFTKEEFDGNVTEAMSLNKC